MRLRNLGTVLVAGALLVGLAACGDDDDDDAGGATTTAAGATTTAASGESTCGDLSGSPRWKAFRPSRRSRPTRSRSSRACPARASGRRRPARQSTAATSTASPGHALAARAGRDGGPQRQRSIHLVAGQVQDFDIALSQVADHRRAPGGRRLHRALLRVRPGRPGRTRAPRSPRLDGGQGAAVGRADRHHRRRLPGRRREAGAEPRCSRTSPRPSPRSQARQVDAVMMDTAIVLGQAAESDGALEVVAQFAGRGVRRHRCPKGSHQPRRHQRHADRTGGATAR